MTKYFIGGKEYHPGDYEGHKQDAQNLADRYIDQWERTPARDSCGLVVIPPSICISRKIGSGALEIADMVGRQLGLTVVDREIIDHIARTRDLSRKTVDCFDEKYPGRIKELLGAILGEKSFVMSDFTRQLFTTVYSIAGLNSSIFVGRGTHLFLPRERILAVRIVAGPEFRAKRLAQVLDVPEKEAAAKLEKIDQEQADFFKKIYAKENASTYEFDMTINRTHLKQADLCAQLICTAFERKFMGSLEQANEDSGLLRREFGVGVKKQD
ncbi:MAG: cytidylate kinase-like family protein [Desulfatibacillaceae bacterium]|nr:cytidylate kinase-like family protein [Desulfatibacillaceae bacterium]